MLTQADDFPVHQTPEPVALGPTDRNFYDRYFFNGYSPSGDVFFAVAFGMYPNLNIADAHFSVLHEGTQYCLHASRYLQNERMNLQVGPISIEVIEPLKRLRVRVESSEGIRAEIVFDGRSFPIQEPRFTHRFGTRVFMDVTRLTQNCVCSGWVEIDGRRVDLPAESLGTRDRSWGIRPIGTPDAQPFAPPFKPSVFWLWTPVHLPDESLYFHVMAEASGKAWNTRAVAVKHGATADEMAHTESPTFGLTLPPGLRHPIEAQVNVSVGQRKLTLKLEPQSRFHMKGIGYAHPNWGHGMHKGELVVEREDFRPSELDLTQLENFHVQAFSLVTLQEPGQPDRRGIGTFEYSIRGAYAPLNLS